MTEFWLSTLRPLIADLVLPPVPLFVVLLVAMHLAAKHPRASRFALLAGMVGLWTTSSLGAAELASRMLLAQFDPLSRQRISELREAASLNGRTGVVALGSGVQAFAPEYGGPKLTGESLARLLYAIRLGRELGAPVGFSGGIGWAGEPGPTEAEAAQQAASLDFGMRLRWVEARSRDTRQNAVETVNLLLADDVQRIVIVTSAAHMQRSIAAFADAAANAGTPDLILVPAPMNFTPRTRSRVFDWLPSSEGFTHFRVVLREYILVLGGA
jgi:uncharacterized SAM-binding protein YcdF (DUF218 family)